MALVGLIDLQTAPRIDSISAGQLGSSVGIKPVPVDTSACMGAAAIYYSWPVTMQTHGAHAAEGDARHQDEAGPPRQRLRHRRDQRRRSACVTSRVRDQHFG